jgi:hypothetical protein
MQATELLTKHISSRRSRSCCAHPHTHQVSFSCSAASCAACWAACCSSWPRSSATSASSACSSQPASDVSACRRWMHQQAPRMQERHRQRNTKHEALGSSADVLLPPPHVLLCCSMPLVEQQAKQSPDPPESAGNRRSPGKRPHNSCLALPRPASPATEPCRGPPLLLLRVLLLLPCPCAALPTAPAVHARDQTRQPGVGCEPEKRRQQTSWFYQ